MKLAASSLQADLRDIERAVTTGTREAGRGRKTELRRQAAQLLTRISHTGQVHRGSE